jgi:phage terminase large subunit
MLIMIIQRYFAVKGTDILYVVKDKADSVPESIWEEFKRTVCGEGDLESFPEKVHVPLVRDGFYVDTSLEV